MKLKKVNMKNFKIIFLVTLFFSFRVYSNNCPINVCGKYEKYSECWNIRMKTFDLCVINMNKNNKYVKECIESVDNFPYKIDTPYKHNIDNIYFCNNTRNLKNNNDFLPYLRVGKCFNDIKNKINKIGKDINGKEINCFNLPNLEYGPNCPKDICNKYAEYSECWDFKIPEFDYCIIQANKNNKYVKKCSDLYGSTYVDINNNYSNINPDKFKYCNNIPIINSKYNKYYLPYLYTAKCFDDVKKHINHYNFFNNLNKNLSCFNLDK